MNIELTDTQTRKLIKTWVHETMSTEDFEDFIVVLAKDYKKWYGSDIAGLVMRIEGK